MLKYFAVMRYFSENNTPMKGFTDMVQVDSVNRRQSCIVPMAQGAGIGALTGYVLKYAQPLTPDEINNPEYKKVINSINESRTVYRPQTKEYLDTLKAKESRSLAEDVFIKMFDGMKDGDKLKKSTIRNAIKEITEKNPAEVIEFKNICKASIKEAKETAKRCIDAYNLVTKHVRPTAFFVVGGAIIGGIVGLLSKVLKTEVQQH